MIKQYIRGEKGEKIGVMIADIVGRDSYGIGYSVARPDSEDKFDENLGLTIASNRAHSIRANKKLADKKALSHTDQSIDLRRFTDRCKRYFKDRKPLATTEEKVVV